MLEQKLEKLAKILLYAVPFLTLIFVNGFYFPFIVGKTIYFRLIIELALTAYLLLLALNFKKYRPKLNITLALVLIFFLVQFVAAIFGYDFYKSFWSDFERMEGLISLIFLTAYLFLLQAFLRVKKDWLFYIRLIIAASALVSLYGLVQKFDILPVFEAGANRIPATIGNAAFLAGYLLLAAGLAVYYYFNETDKYYRYGALAAAVLDIAVLLLTSTRGAILGLIFGLTVFLVLSAIFAAVRLRRNSLVILLVLAALIGGFFIFRPSLKTSNVEFLRRLATISFNDATVKNRLVVWRMAIEDFKYHPLLGVGMENFDIIYNKYYTPYISENWFDRTHNVYLDQLTSAGLLGLAAYLAIFFHLFYRLFKRRREDFYGWLVLTGLLAAYGVHNFFVFDTISTSFLYFFLIGLASFNPQAAEAPAEVSPPNNRAFNYALLGLLSANIFVFYQFVYLPLSINRALYIGYYYALADPYRSYENFQYALNYKFASNEAAIQLNGIVDALDSTSGVNPANREKFYELDREKLQAAVNYFPLDIRSKVFLAQLILNNYRDPAELDEAAALLLDSIKLSPTRVEPYYLLYNVYAKRGEKAQARAVLEDLAKKLPDYGGAKIMLMADVYKEDPARAQALYEEGVKQFGYADFDGLKKIIAYFLDLKKYAATVPYYLDLIAAEPKRYDYRLDLAKVYYLTGNFDAAVEQVNLISAQSPDTLKNNNTFLDLLKKAAGDL